MVAKGGLRDPGVVLGADGQNDPALLELLGVMLQGEMGFAGRASLAEHDAVEPVVADHAAPQRIVEIEHQTFLRQPPLRGEDARGEIAIKTARPAERFRACPEASARRRTRHQSRPAGWRARHRARSAPSSAAASARRSLSRATIRAGRAWNQPIIAAEQRFAHVEEGLLNDRRAPISRALRHSERNSAINRPIAASTSAAVAVSGTPAIASRAESENSAACGLNRCSAESDRADPAGIAHRTRYGPRSAIFASSRRPGSRGASGRRSRRRGWRAGLSGSRRLPSHPVARAPDRAARSPGTRADGPLALPSPQGDPSASFGPARRADRRGNRTRPAASS